MRLKKYFWNLPKHRLLDKKMGLLFRDNFSELAEACGEPPERGGTRGLQDIFIHLADKLPPFKWLTQSVVYDYESNGQAHRFYRTTHPDTTKPQR